MKIYDCFMYLNEFELLELRLNELWDIVDHFVLVESPTSHTGILKPLYFEEKKESFAPYMDKIIHVIHELPHPREISGGARAVERHQRDGALEGISDADPDDIIMISDVDEIPRAEVLQRTIKSFVQPCVLNQTLYCYWLNCFYAKSWKGTAITKREWLDTPSIERIRKNGKHHKNKERPYITVPNGG